MKRRLHGKRILITGASSGIGCALAEAAARRGARVALVARSQEPLEDVALRLRRYDTEVLAIPGDVTKPDDRRRMLDTTVSQFGGLDILINNAGIGSFGHFAESSEAVLREVMEVNFFAPAELIRLATPVLRQGNQPAIVNISSRCGRRAMPAWPEYSASKFALSGLHEALMAEAVRSGIHFLLVVPGMTRSDLRNRLLRNEGKLDLPSDKGMTAEYVAEQTLRALEKSRNEIVLGYDARLMLLLNRWFPRLMNWLVRRKVRQLYADELGAAPEAKSTVVMWESVGEEKGR
jgi:short-subunit dehydrogenase